jgi:hypothetical protein
LQQISDDAVLRGNTDISRFCGELLFPNRAWSDKIRHNLWLGMKPREDGRLDVAGSTTGKVAAARVVNRVVKQRWVNCRCGAGFPGGYCFLRSVIAFPGFFPT